MLSPARAAIVIVHWNSPDAVARCLPTLPPRHIVVVDNASPREAYGELSSIIRASGRDDVALARAPTNGGYGAGCNLGRRHAHAAGAANLLFLNPDTEMAPHACELLEEALVRDMKLAAVAPVIRRQDTDAIDFSGGAIDWYRGAATHRTEPIDAGTIALSDFLTGAALMARSEAFDDVGGFDEAYFLYWEDVDLSFKLARRGRLGVVADAIVRHETSPHLGGSPVALYYGARNALSTVKRYHPLSVHLAFLRYSRIARAFEKEGKTRESEMVRKALVDFRAGATGPFQI